MKRRKNLSDKRSKRKIVAENRQLNAEVAILKCQLAVGKMLVSVLESHAKQSQFSVGGIVTPGSGEPVVICREAHPMTEVVIEQLRDKMSGGGLVVPAPGKTILIQEERP